MIRCGSLTLPFAAQLLSVGRARNIHAASDEGILKASTRAKAIPCELSRSPWLLLLVGALAPVLGVSASCRNPVNLRSRMPSKTVTADGVDYEIFTCRGVNQSVLPCPKGEARRFRGALVCKLDGHWSDPAPIALCSRLPNGCELYVPPKPDSKGESLPESYASVVKQVLPKVKRCSADTWAFLRSGNDAPSKNEEITLAGKLRSAITIEHRVGPCCSGATGHLCLTLDFRERNTILPPAFLARVVETADKIVPKSFTLELDIKWTAIPPPRCESSDPNCGPQSIWTGFEALLKRRRPTPVWI